MKMPVLPAWITVMSLLVIGESYSQVASKAILHFATNEYRLTDIQERYLDSLSKTLKNIPDAYGFVVSGHTDSVGSNAYNHSLSYKRAMAVAAYLENKGFKQSRMKLEAKGFTKPIASSSNENNKERNRRVEIVFHFDLPEAKKIATVSLPSQVHTVDEKGGTVLTSSGTKISIPPNAFADANGNPVTGEVKIGYTEYRDAIDFLLSGIPMHFNDGKEAIPFNSAGMFTITASQGNTQLYLQNGKRVNVGFNYDGTVRNANFYRWDATRNTWIQQQPLTQSLFDQFRDYMLWFESDDPSICSQHEDLKQVLFVNTGLRYSDEADSGIYRLYESVKLYELEALTREKQRQYERKAKLMLRKYQVDVDKRFLARTGFKLNQVGGKRDRSSDMLERITFRKNLSNTMIDSLERMIFNDYAIERSDSGFLLVLYKGVSKVTIPGLEIRQSAAEKGSDPGEWISDMGKYYASYKVTAARYRDTAESFAQQCDFFRSQMQLIRPLSWKSLDSLNCFRSMHNSWMNRENLGLSLSGWLAYYQKHKTSFASIYRSLQETDTYAAMAKKVKRFWNLRMLYTNPEASLNLTSEDIQLPGNFSLSSLGTYNCDQLQRLQDPVTLYAQYTNMQGKEIRPVIALLIDSRLNGILRYDGSYGLSPYRIAFSASSDSRMVLIDANGESYLVKPEAFSKLDLSLNKINNIYTFVAEPIGKAGNKDELKQRLRM